MQLNEAKESKPVNQWVAMNHILFVYKAAGAAIAGLCLVLGVLCIVLANRNPIVALAHDNDYLYFRGEQKDIPLTEANIRRFIESYVKLNYEWDALDPVKITQGISPLVTDGFRDKDLALLIQKRDKDFVGKKIQQNVSGLRVQITKESTIALFDIVMRIEGIPLIVPTQVSFQLVKGNSTQWNLLGLYVNGETVHEGK